MLQGFITERDRQATEEAFPGIWGFYAELTDKPCTFLELVWRYSHRYEVGEAGRSGHHAEPR
jgi:hypothetical protein